MPGSENSDNTQEPCANPDPNRYVWIPAGTFTMGSPADEVEKDSDERPQTVVTLTQGFWMSKCQTTQAEYVAVMGSNPSFFRGDVKRPVEQVGWNDAIDYCGKMTVRMRASGRLPENYEYRLPTEAEWEFACRAGAETRFSFGDDYGGLGQHAWFIGNSGKTTQPVGCKPPNAWGLHDMHGNVWEWCSDWYGESLPGGSVNDPRGPATGLRRVNRGGGWLSIGWYCRSASRFYVWSVGRMNALGFRPVIAPSQAK
jgi:formylglycine-generating enzyme required for sulfatase activity